MRQLIAKPGCTIQIGRLGENIATEVLFPLRETVETYGDGIPRAFIKNPHGDIYPKELTVEGDFAKWVITSEDLAYPGYGALEFHYLGRDGSELIAKPLRFGLSITTSFSGDAVEPPEPLKAWLENLADSVEKDKREAADSANESKASAEEAAEKLDELKRGIASGDFKGETGPMGPQGPKGEPGKDADPVLLKEIQDEQAAQKALLTELDASTVKRVNGLEPIDGDVTVVIDPAQVQESVQRYLDEHPFQEYDDSEIREAIDTKYTKPQTGIPESDLSQDVKDKINSAGAGTVQTVNGNSPDESGNVALEIPSIDGLVTEKYVNEELAKKVDNVDGKGLSTNDYNNTAKAKVDAIPAAPKYTDTIYDDTDVKRRLSELEAKEDKDTIYDDTEIREKIADIEEEQTDQKEHLSSLDASVEGLENGKLDKDATYTKEDIDEKLKDAGKVKTVNRKQPDANGNVQIDISSYDDTGIRDEISQLKQSDESLLTKIQKNATDIEVQTSRIDMFTSLPAGSTSGDAELFDIRVGADGETYNTAGNAVRGQVSQLSESILNIEQVKADKVALAEAESKITELQRANDLLWKLNKGQTYDFEEVESEAYSVDVPSGAILGDLVGIGGKSVVLNQLVYFSGADVTKTINGITYTNNKDGSFTIDGTATETVNFLIVRNFLAITKKDHKYFITGINGGSNSTYILRIIGGYFDTGNPTIRTKIEVMNSEPSKGLSIRVFSGATVSNIKIIPQIIDLTQMFGAGNEPTLEECQKLFTEDYYPYNEGEIKSAEVEEVVSSGINWFSENMEVGTFNVSTGKNESSDARLRSDFIPILPNTEYYMLQKGSTSRGRAIFCDENKNIIKGYGDFPIEYTTTQTPPGVKGYFKTPQNARYFRYSPPNFFGTNYDEEHRIHVNIGKTDKGYTPYFKPHIKKISDIISKYFPNGMKSAGSAYDLFDLENGVAVQNLSSMNLGSVNWTKNTNYYNSNYSVPVDGKKDESVNNRRNILCSKYDTISVNDLLKGAEGIGYYTYNNVNYLHLPLTEAENSAELKEKLQNVMLYYELEIPIITPIDPQDLEILKAFDVESGGTITFKQADDSLHLPIPNTMKYLLKLDEVN